MTITIKHAKTDTVPDWTQPQLDTIIAGGAAPLPPAGTLLANVVLPSDWNASLTTSMSTGKVVGRTTAGTGAFEELDISALQTPWRSNIDGDGFWLQNISFILDSSILVAIDPNLRVLYDNFEVPAWDWKQRFGYASDGVTILVDTSGTPNTTAAALSFDLSYSAYFTSLTANRVVVSGAGKQLASSATTNTQLGYLSTTTSDVQTQLNAKQTAYANTAISSNITLAVNTANFVDTSAARTLQLPAPAAGASLRVKDATFQAQTNNITFTQNGSEKLEGTAGSYIFSANGGSILWMSNGTDWFIMGN